MPIPYINRELSWLEFNQRVINEGARSDLPPLERLKFLAIAASNLDEFFMVRVGGLEMLGALEESRVDPAGMSPGKQLRMIRQRVEVMAEETERVLVEELFPELARHKLQAVPVEKLKPGQLDHIADVFEESILPLLTPVELRDGERAIEMVPSLCLCLLCEIGSSDEPGNAGCRRVLVPLPSTLSRFIRLPNSSGYRFVLLEEVIMNFVGSLFPDELVHSAGLFRITRNSDAALKEDAYDFARQMVDALAERKRGACVRLEIDSRFPDELLEGLLIILGARSSHVYPSRVPLGLGRFMELSETKDFEQLKIESWSPVQAAGWLPGTDIFNSLRNGDMLLHHPYESYDPVLALIEQAAVDSDVLAIKQTLYRTANNSRVISALIAAAENGKNVTVVVELKARFDEARNLERAEELVRSGVQLIYGVKGLKTHCKATLVVRKEGDALKRYTHFGTGNYNEVTARLYTDISYLTSRENYGSEAAQLFNALTGGVKLRKMKLLTVAPFLLRKKLLSLIGNEASRAENGEEAGIDIKVNSLQDEQIIEALYAASGAGVKIRLNVRGICCLQPGIKKISKNIEVSALVDRYLEHARVLSFHNGGKARVFLSSADLMKRSLDRRVELMVEVNDDLSKERLLSVLNGHFKDNSQAYRLESDGTYQRFKSKKGKKSFKAQEHFQRVAVKEAGRIPEAKDMRLLPHRPPGQSQIPSTEGS
ncbi:MAG: polyphosphate kinase 1 [Verrucomicrobiaceae bacterium]|nr:polyphosphate kinase 1 [Verrucomicrobiaceae bacterium]